MSHYISRLIEVYESQRSRYERILDVVAEERRSLLDGKPLSSVISLLRSKSELMKQIENLDESISDEKREYHERYASASPQQSLLISEVISALKQLIERIMELEKENENIIMRYHNSMGDSVCAAEGRR